MLSESHLYWLTRMRPLWSRFPEAGELINIDFRACLNFIG